MKRNRSPMFLFVDELIVKGFFRGLKYRKVIIMGLMFGKIWRVAIPLYPNGFLSRHVMNLLDESVGRMEK